MSTPTQQPTAQRASTASTVTIVTAVVGGVVLFGAAVSSTMNAFDVFSPRPDLSAVMPFDEDGAFDDGDRDDRGGSGTDTATSGDELRAAVSGITGLEVDASAASFTLEFDDVDEAVLTVDRRGGDRGGDWTMRTEDAELVVERASGARTGGCLFGCGDRGGERVTLTLPQSLSESGRLTGDITLSGGELRAGGAFAQLDLEVNAGHLVFAGDAAELDLGVRAGQAEVEAADVREAQIEVEAGAAQAKLTGSAPTLVDVEASTGSVDLQLPKGEYRLDASGELGKIDSGLATDEQSKHLVRVRSELAEVTLR